MRKIFILTLFIFTHALTFGRAEISTKMPILASVGQEVPVEQLRATKKAAGQQTENCFVYTVAQQKDSLVYVSESLLEYGWAGANARMVITRYAYDPVKKEAVEKEGRTFFFPDQELQFINGTYKTEDNILIFTPDKVDQYEERTFKIVYNPETNKIDSLLDENNNNYLRGDCLEPVVGM